MEGNNATSANGGGSGGVGEVGFSFENSLGIEAVAETGKKKNDDGNKKVVRKEGGKIEMPRRN